jgi:hypothetical protein
MLRSSIEMGEHCPGFVRNNRYFVILSGKLTNRIQGIKQHNRNEFDLRADCSSKKLNILKAADVAVFSTRNLGLSLLDIRQGDV